MTKKVLVNRLLPNSNANELNSIYIGGHLEKSFFWLDDKDENVSHGTPRTIKDSVFLSELYKAMLDPNCSYLTYLNSSILCDPPEKRHYPERVSCLVKEIYSDGCYFGEVAGSRMANLLQQPTVFNIGANMYNDEHKVADPYLYDLLVSVDFVPWGHRILTFEDFEIYFTRHTPLEEIIQQIDINIPKFAKENGIKVNKKPLERLKKDFIKQFLFRFQLCGDQDYEDKNVIVVVDYHGNICLGPNLDMEYMFKENNARHNYKIARHNMKYAYTHYPNEVLDIIQKATGAFSTGKIQDIIERTPRKSVYDAVYYKNLIKDNLGEMCDCVSQLWNASKQDNDFTAV